MGIRNGYFQLEWLVELQYVESCIWFVCESHSCSLRIFQCFTNAFIDRTSVYPYLQAKILTILISRFAMLCSTYNPSKW